MRHIVKILDNVNNINSFDIADEIRLVRGNGYDLNFMLMTERMDAGGDYILTRYVPQGLNISVEVQFDNLDVTYHVRRVAQKSFLGDDSIWKIPLLPQDQLMFNSMRITLNEDGKKTTFMLETDIATEEVGSRRRFT